MDRDGETVYVHYVKVWFLGILAINMVHLHLWQGSQKNNSNKMQTQLPWNAEISVNLLLW